MSHKIPSHQKKLISLQYRDLCRNSIRFNLYCEFIKNNMEPFVINSFQHICGHRKITGFQGFCVAISIFKVLRNLPLFIPKNSHDCSDPRRASRLSSRTAKNRCIPLISLSLFFFCLILSLINLFYLRKLLLFLFGVNQNIVYDFDN